MSHCRIRIATTQAGLAKGWLVQALKIPYPDLPVYSDHSTKVPMTHGGQAQRGFPSASLTWNRLSFDQARTIVKLAEDAADSSDGLIYLTIDRSWGRRGAYGDWIDIKGRPIIPDAPPASGTKGKMNDNLTLVVEAIEIVNDPASF